MEFMTDQPISSSSEDKLNRTSFADLLAKAILSYRETKSLVLALYGTWGSGKTSILNLTLEHICTAVKNINNDAKPIIVSFNPWYFSEQNQLISQFFKQLSVTLKRVDYASQAKAISEKIDIYSKFFDPLVLVPVAGSFIGVLLSVVRGAGKGIKGWSEAKSASLDSVKKDLDRLFDLQKNKTIIVIDDLDRLSDVEIRQMFQLVKSVCDFHNTIYLLAFDKKVVARALDRFQEEQGFAYLEKVIQVPFEIPLVSRQNLETLLLNNITNLIKDVPEDKFDNMRWWNLYAGVLKYYFRNIRDINRYINSLRFGYHLIKDELNTVDYLAISALQVFIPEVYLQIRSNRLLFSGIVDSTGRSNEQTREQERKKCDEIISNSLDFPQEKLKELLIMLFPRLEAIYANVHYGYESMKEWRRERRICSPDIFDTYFRLAILEEDISRNEMESILFLANNRALFSEALLKLNEGKRIVRFLELLEDYTDNVIPAENIESVITVLLDVGDLFPEEDIGFLSLGTPMRILRLVHQLIRRKTNQNERFEILKNAINNAHRSIYSGVHEISVRNQALSKHVEGQDDKSTINAQQMGDLEKIACEKIKIWAEDGRLKKHQHLVEILYAWKTWGNLQDVQKFVVQMILDDTGLIDFLSSFLSKVKSKGLGSYAYSIKWRMSPKSIGEFIDPAKLEPRARNIFNSAEYTNLNENQKLAVKTFLDAVDGKIKDDFEDND